MSCGIDWPAVLQDVALLLGEAGPGGARPSVPCSTQDLADDLKVARGTLRGWLDGSEPRHSDGERVLDRWCCLTGRRREFAPILRPLRTATVASFPAARRLESAAG